jgi:hypothetical protein
LVVTRQTTTGKASGATTDVPMFIAWRFRDGLATGMHWSFDRGRALERAGLADETGANG